MSKKPNIEMCDSNNPEWTDEMFAQAKRASELPASLQSKLRGIGPQKAPKKLSTPTRKTGSRESTE